MRHDHAAGFGSTLLKSTAGAIQIHSDTARVKWYATYFDDPNDQYSINKGINYWNNVNLPTGPTSSIAYSLDLISEVDQTDFDNALNNGEFTTPTETIFTDGDYNELSDEQKLEIQQRAEENSKIILEMVKEKKKEKNNKK